MKIMDSVIGRTVTVTVDRPLGSYHPKHRDMYYPINYGYVEGIMAPDGEEQDAYILGVDEAVEKFTGTIIAIVHRHNDVEEKWVVAPEGMSFTREEIWEQIRFQEQYFDSQISNLRTSKFCNSSALHKVTAIDGSHSHADTLSLGARRSGA